MLKKKHNYQLIDIINSKYFSINGPQLLIILKLFNRKSERIKILNNNIQKLFYFFGLSNIIYAISTFVNIPINFSDDQKSVLSLIIGHLALIRNILIINDDLNEQKAKRIKLN